MTSQPPFVVIAGATGKLGGLVAFELRLRNVPVKAVVRPGTAAQRLEKLHNIGVTTVEIALEASNVPALTEELRGARTVVSTLTGVRDTLIDAQSVLLDASVAAGVQRFIPSDFGVDFTKTTPGTNRNADWRREFHARLEASGIAWTSVLNGAFTEFMGGDASVIKHSWHRVIHFGSADQKYDFSLVPDVAAYTAAAAADERPTPKILRVAGSEVSPRDIAEIVSSVRGEKYKTLWLGSEGFLSLVAAIMRMIIGREHESDPPWAKMQYMLNMVSGEGKLSPLDNDRYPEVRFTTLEEMLSQKTQ